MSAPITEAEDQLLDAVLAKWDPLSFGRLSVRSAREMISTANLPEHTQSEILNIAKLKGYLLANRVLIALRLIGWAQSGESPSVELGNKSGPLAKLQGINPSAPSSLPRSPSPRTPLGLFALLASDSAHADAETGFFRAPVEPQITGSPVSKQLTGTSSRNHDTRVSFPHPQQSTGILPWDVTAQEKFIADMFFEQLDIQKRGYLTGDIAVSLMNRSNLPESILAQIWGLSDIHNIGALNKDSFAVAMHLISGTLAGKEVPTTLPPSLIPPSMRNASTASTATQEIQHDAMQLDDTPPASVNQNAPASSQQFMGSLTSRTSTLLYSNHANTTVDENHKSTFLPEKRWSRDFEEKQSTGSLNNMFSEDLDMQNPSHFTEPTDLTGYWTNIENSPYVTGGHSDIYKAKLHKGSHPHAEQLVAVKVLRSIRIRPGSTAAEILHKRLQREVQVWSRLEHRNIVPFLGFAYHGNSPCMVAPWYANGDVPDYIRENPGIDRTQLVSGSIEGIVYLHSRKPPIIHGDLKASNILVDDDGHPRITDFGLSRALQDGPTGLTTSSGVTGTHRWMAPELLMEQGRATTATDIYALVLLILEIYTLKAPFAHLDQGGFYVQIYQKASPQRSHYSPFDPPEEIWHILEKGWSFDPEQRPSASSISNMFTNALSSTGWRFKP